MVNLTQVLVALILFAVLLAVALTLLSGIIPAFREGSASIQCLLGLVKCPTSP